MVTKQIFGGLGTNFVNPALAARALLLAAWPLHMTRDWVNPMTYDAVTTATPLVAFKGTGQTALAIKGICFWARESVPWVKQSILALLLGAFI